MNHTPGPWSPPHFSTGKEGECRCRSIVNEDYCGAICEIRVDNGSPPESEAIANGFLIASSPELLEALKVVRKTLTALPKASQCKFYSVLYVIDSALHSAEPIQQSSGAGGEEK